MQRHKSRSCTSCTSVDWHQTRVTEVRFECLKDSHHLHVLRVFWHDFPMAEEALGPGKGEVVDRCCREVN